MKKIAVAGVVIAVAMLSACAIKPSPSELASADYGAYPDNYKEIVGGYESLRLKDPSSAVYQYMGMPQKAWNGLGGSQYGYAVCAFINGKNSFGAYVGARPNYFLIRDGRVVRSVEGDGQYMDSLAKGLCHVPD